MPNCWLVKTEPSSYSWDDLVRDGRTSWTGVRNFMARKNLRAMRNGDDVLFYHSVTEKAVVGTAKVVREAYPDTTAKEGEWVAVDIAADKALRRPVMLTDVKANPKLKEMALVRSARLSVQPVTREEFREIVRLGGG